MHSPLNSSAQLTSDPPRKAFSTSKISDDIWILIFRMYLEDTSTMPISLTPVCRQWYNLIASFPTLWSNIVIHVKDSASIPCILSSSTFTQYLARTDYRDDLGTNIPLDIEIRFQLPTDQDHYVSCGELRACSAIGCEYAFERHKQLERLISVLAGPGSESKSKRIDRWRTLIINFDPTFYNGRHFLPVNGSFILGADSHVAPRLTHLSLKDFPKWYTPHPKFAPNLIEFELQNPDLDQILEVPKLRALSLVFDFKDCQIHGDFEAVVRGISGKYPATELHIRYINYIPPIEHSLHTLPLRHPRYRSFTDLEMANLKTLWVDGKIPEGFLNTISICYHKLGGGTSKDSYAAYSHHDRRLDSVNLSDIDPYTSSILAKVPIIQNTREVVFRNLRSFHELKSSPPFRTTKKFPSPMEYLSPFNSRCAIDTEFIVADHEFYKALAAETHVGSIGWSPLH